MTAAAGAPALFLIDKPTGLTSHDVVQQVRRWTGVRRVGHGGTLDPMATGLLPVFVGSATRLVEYISSHPKSYSATILLGVSTDTDDADGSILAEAPVPDVGLAGLDRLLDRFRGAVEQVPPIYSAIKVGGVSAHRAARRGEPLVLASRPVTFHALTIDGWEPPRLRIEMTVSSGTYVRALARDLGAALGCGGHVTQMRRTRIGPVGVAEAHTPDTLAAAFREGRGWECASTPARFVEHWPQLTLTPPQRRLIRNGQPIQVSGPDGEGEYMLALDPSGRPLAVLVSDGSWPERWRPLKVLSASG